MFQSVLSKIKSRASEGGEIVLDFTGVEQTSDLVFYLFHTSNEDLLKKVTTVDLTGCLRITDQGIIWMASAFTGLKTVLYEHFNYDQENLCGYKIRVCSLGNSPKNLELSLKTELDFWYFLGKENKHLTTKLMEY